MRNVWKEHRFEVYKCTSVLHFVPQNGWNHDVSYENGRPRLLNGRHVQKIILNENLMDSWVHPLHSERPRLNSETPTHFFGLEDVAKKFQRMVDLRPGSRCSVKYQFPMYYIEKKLKTVCGARLTQR